MEEATSGTRMRWSPLRSSPQPFPDKPPRNSIACLMSPVHITDCHCVRTIAIVLLYSAQCLAQSCGLQVAEKIETSAVRGSERQQVKGEKPPPSSNNSSLFWDAGQAQPLHWGRGREGTSQRDICIGKTSLHPVSVFWSRASWESSFQSWQKSR